MTDLDFSYILATDCGASAVRAGAARHRPGERAAFARAALATARAKDAREAAEEALRGC